METQMKRKFKIDVNVINEKAIEAAFGENRVKVNEEGLSPKALEAKKTVNAIEAASKMFVHEVYEEMMNNGERITPDDRREIEAIGTEAISRGENWMEYLSQFCYGGES